MDDPGVLIFSHQNGQGGNTTLGHFRYVSDEWVKYEHTFTLDATRTYLYIFSYTTNGPAYQFALDGLELEHLSTTDTTQYTYDTLNRLVAADENGDQVFEAEYDYRTRRISKTEGSDSTYYRYDGGVSFQEVDDAGAVNVEFVRGSGMGGGIGSILYSDRDPSGGGGGAGSLTREYFTYNAVGHTVALTDALGDITKTTTYEAFGNTVSETGSSDNNRLANTKERDFSIGLDNHGFRYYDPSTGRYTTRDPIGYGDGPNVYQHVRDNPLNQIDSLGLSGTWEWGGWVDYTVVGTIIHAGYDVVYGLPRDGAEAVAEGAVKMYYGAEAAGESKRRVIEQAAAGNFGHAEGAAKNFEQDFQDFAEGTAVVATSIPGTTATGPVASPASPAGSNIITRQATRTTVDTAADLAEGSARRAALTGVSEVADSLSNLGAGYSARNLDSLGRFAPGSAFSGVYNPRTGKYLAYPSEGASLIGGGTIQNQVVNRRGGHRVVNDAFSGINQLDPNENIGFTMFLDEDGAISVDWLSRSVNGPNPNFEGSLVPEELRSQIIGTIQSSTEREVKSR